MASYNSEILKASEKYLSMGYSIIPVGRDKKPLIEWKKYQKERPSIEEIEKWFVRYPDANIGIITGKISNLAVVDIEKGGNVSGLPMTRTVKTGGGGWHYYYRFREGIENRVRIKDRTDIRGEGGYVVAPPSIHGKTGEKYFWSNEDEELADFPQASLEKSLRREEDEWRVAIKGVSEGKRNYSAAQIFGKLFSLGIKDKEIIWQLGDGWNLRNNPPLHGRELRSVFESIERKELEKAQKKKKLLPLALRDLMKKEFSGTRWMIEKLIPEESLTCVSGDPSSFKTWLILDIALKVASGELFLRKFKTTEVGVLLIDEENGERLLCERIKTLGCSNNNLPIHFLPYSGFKLSEETVEELIIFCVDRKIKLIIFDSLVRIHNADENSAGEMAGVLGLLKNFSKSGISVIFTHHNRKKGFSKNKASQEMRGSSDILASVNCHLAVSKKDDCLEVEQTKLRDAEEIKPFSISIIKKDGKLFFEYIGEIESSYTTKPNRKKEVEEFIISILDESDRPMFQQEIFKEVREKDLCGKSTFKPILHEMVENGKLYKKPGERNKTYYSLKQFDADNPSVSQKGNPIY